MIPRFLFLTSLTAVLLSVTAYADVFPLVIDGKLVDGSYYKSTLFVQPATDNVTLCEVYGVGNVPLALTIVPGSFYSYATPGTSPLKVSYAVVGCSFPATIQMNVGHYASDGTPIAVNGMNPGKLSGGFTLPVDTNQGQKVGFSIVNPTSTSRSYNLALGGQTRTITIDPGTQLTLFADQLFDLPKDTQRTDLMTMFSFDCSGFYVQGVNFTGTTSSAMTAGTIPPACPSEQSGDE